VLWGANVNLDFEPAQTKWKGEGIVELKLNDNSVVVTRASYIPGDELLVWGFSFFHKISDLTKFAIEHILDPSKGPAFLVGGEYKVNDKTTVKGRALVKATESKVPDYRWAFSVNHRVSKLFTTTVGVDLNIRHVLGEATGEAHSFGVEIKLDTE